MIQFSRVGLDKNLQGLIVPIGEYWLASDINKYARGDGETKWEDLTKHDYTGDPATSEPIDVIYDPTIDVFLDGNNDTIKIKRTIEEGEILEEGEIYYDTLNNVLYIGDGINTIDNLRSVSIDHLNQNINFQFVGDVAGSGILDLKNDLNIILDVIDNSHRHNNSTIDSLDWAKLLNVPSPTISLTGDVSGSATLNNLEDATINVSVLDDSHTHDARYYTETEVDNKLATKSDVGHMHDDRYYTETEVDNKLATKSDVGHIHDDRYYTETEIDTKFTNYYTKTNLQTSGQAQIHWNNLTNVPDPTITLSGDVSGSATMTNLGSITITTTVANDSHSHSNTTITSVDWSKLLNVPSPTIELTGDVTGSGTMTDLGDVSITATVGNDSHSHSDSTITSVDWSKLLNVPSPTITVTGDVTGSGTMTDLGDVSITATVSNDSHSHSDTTITSVDWSKLLNVPSPTITLTGDVSGSATMTNLGDVSIIATVANDSHTHDTRYYTETEVDNKLATKSDVGHIHDDRYYTETEIDTKFANYYTKPNLQTSGQSQVHWNNITNKPDPTITLSGDVSGSATMTDLGSITITTTVANDSHTHTDSTITAVDWSKLLNVPSPTITLTGDVSGSGTMTNLGNVSITATVANDSHTHDTRYYTESEINTFLANKSDVGHTHTKSEITDFSHTHTISEITDINNANVAYAVSSGDSDTLDGYHYTDIKQYIDNAVTGINVAYIADGTIDANTGYYNVTYIPSSIPTTTITHTVTSPGQILDKFIVKPAEVPHILLQGFYRARFTASVDKNAVTLSGRMYERKSDGTEVLLVSANSVTISATSPESVIMDMYVPEDIPMAVDSSIVFEAYVVNISGGAAITLTIQLSPQNLLSITAPTTVDVLTATFETIGDHTNDINALYTYLDSGLATKSDVGHTHTKADITDFNHTHDDRYYTESEIDTKFANYYTKTNLQTSGQAQVHWNNLTNVPDPTITLSGDVSGSATMTNLGSITITTTVANDSHAHTNSTITSVDWSKLLNVPSPTITLTGDVSGSGTMTALGNVSITATVANDSHTHDTRYYTETEVDNKLATKSDVGHTHTKANITDFAHTHTISEITNIGNASVNYATSAGNADKVDGKHASAFILNNGATVGIKAGTNDSKGSAGTTGNVYIATDTQEIYYDNGTSWVKVAVGIVAAADIDGGEIV